MDKFELAQKLTQIEDINGRVSLEDLAKIVMHPDTPDEIVDAF